MPFYLNGPRLGLSQEAQDELIRSAIEIERKHVGVYELDDGELADIEEGLAEIERGELASDEEVTVTFDALRRRSALRRK